MKPKSPLAFRTSASALPFLSSPSAAILRPRPASIVPQFHIVLRISAIESYCAELCFELQLQTLDLIASQPCLAHDRVLYSRLSPIITGDHTTLSINTTSIISPYKVADLLE